MEDGTAMNPTRRSITRLAGTALAARVLLPSAPAATTVDPTSVGELFADPKSAAAIGLALLAIPAGTARAANPQQIDNAIKKGVDFIYSQQQKTGGRWEKPDKRVGDDHNTWPEFQGDSYGGFTSLSTYALLAAGETPKDKRVAAAVGEGSACVQQVHQALALLNQRQGAP